METQAPKKRRWPVLVALGIGGVMFVGGCSMFAASVPHPDQYRVQPVPTVPMPIVAGTPAPAAAPTTAWDVEHIYADGQYEVGKDIYEGKWKTAGKVSGPMGCSIQVRNAQGGTDEFKYGDGQAIVTVHNGQTIQVSSCQTLVHQGPVPK